MLLTDLTERRRVRTHSRWRTLMNTLDDIGVLVLVMLTLTALVLAVDGLWLR